MEQLKRGLTNAAKRQMLKATEQPETASEAMQRENGVNLRSELPSASGIGRPSSYRNPRAHEDAGTRTDLSGPVLLYLQ
jgi:hypothetical protein